MVAKTQLAIAAGSNAVVREGAGVAIQRLKALVDSILASFSLCPSICHALGDLDETLASELSSLLNVFQPNPSNAKLKRLWSSWAMDESRAKETWCRGCRDHKE